MPFFFISQIYPLQYLSHFLNAPIIFFQLLEPQGPIDIKINDFYKWTIKFYSLK